MPPRVVLDTTAFYPWAAQRTGPLARLFRAAREGDLDVYVPEVVIAETVRHFERDHLRPAHKQMRTALHLARQTGTLPRAFAEYVPNVDADRASFEDVLRQELDDNDVLVLDLPDVSHAEVVERIMRTRKPSKFDEDSYRDILIWESIREFLATKGGSFILVSNNRKDFVEKKGSSAIHSDLADDLEEVNLPRDAVTVVAEPVGVVAEYLQAKDDATEAIRAALAEESNQRGEFEFFLREALLGEGVAGDMRFDIEGDIESILIAGVDSIDDVSVSAIYEIEPGETYGVSLSVGVTLDVEFLITAPSARDLHAGFNVIGDRSGGGYIIDTETKELTIPMDLFWNATEKEWDSDDITLYEVSERGEPEPEYYVGPLPGDDDE